MTNRLFTTPEGVRDIYNGECAVKIDLQNKRRDRMHVYGFDDIETPTFEYFDIFSEERGTVKAKNMYKFFDRDGNTLVLRPDMTPSIARCASKYFKNETGAIRLCYCGHTFVNNSEYQGKQKEVTQLGCELINDPSVIADAEMLAVTIDCLLAAGLEEFRLDVGDIRFFKALVAEAGLDEDKIHQLRHFIIDKNTFGIEDLLKEENVSDELKQVFATLPKMFGGAESLDSIGKVTTNKDALAAIEHLKELRELMKAYGYEKYIGYDLGMLNKYRYYTGIIFNVFTYDIGEPVASGGRYDSLVGQFGKEAAAVGMAIIVDKLQIALSRQGLIPEKLKDIKDIKTENDAVNAIKKAVELRKAGQPCRILAD